MRAYYRDLPRSARVAAALMLLVPVVVWLVVVWRTRPYSLSEIDADRVRVEALPAYTAAVEDCWATWGDLAPACERHAYEAHRQHP